MVLGDVALQDLGMLGRTGPLQSRGTVSNRIRQTGVLVGNHDPRSLLPFVGNVCSEHLLNTENSRHVLWMATQRRSLVFFFASSYTKKGSISDRIRIMMGYCHACCRPRVQKWSPVCEIQKGHLEKETNRLFMHLNKCSIEQNWLCTICF